METKAEKKPGSTSKLAALLRKELEKKYGGSHISGEKLDELVEFYLLNMHRFIDPDYLEEEPEAKWIFQSPAGVSGTCPADNFDLEHLIRTSPLNQGALTFLETNPAAEHAEQQADSIAEIVTGHKLPPSLERVTPRAEQIAKDGLKGTGIRLPWSIREKLEQVLNRDLSRVELHTDNKAAQSAGMINARAFTVGNDIAFGEGEYRPDTNEGQALIAHEVMHTVQDTGLMMKKNNNNTRGDTRLLTIEQSEPEKPEPGADLVIKTNPPLKNVITGSKVTYELDIIKNAGLYYRFSPSASPVSGGQNSLIIEWFMIPGDSAVLQNARGNIIAASKVKGPIKNKWTITWDKPGNHKVCCLIKDNEDRETLISFTQTVHPYDDFIFNQFDKIAYSLPADLYLGLLKEGVKSPDNNQQTGPIQFHLETQNVTDSQTDIEKPKTKAEIENEERKRGINDLTGKLYPQVKDDKKIAAKPIGIPALYVPEDNPVPIKMHLYLVQRDQDTWELIDATIPLAGKIRSYKGDSKDMVYSGDTILQHKNEAGIDSVLIDFARNNPYADGYLVIQNPFTQDKEIVTCKGYLNFKKIQSILSGAGLLTGAAALALTPFPGARIAAGTLLLISLALGATKASMSICDRFAHDNLIWDTETTLDLLQIAGSLAAGAGIATQLAVQGAALSRLGTTLMLIEGVDTGSDVASAIVVSIQHYNQIKLISDNTEMSTLDQQRAIGAILLQIALTAGLTAVGVYQSAKSMREIKILRSFMEEVTPSLANKLSNEEMQTLFKAAQLRNSGQLDEAHELLQSVKKLTPEEIEEFYQVIFKLKQSGIDIDRNKELAELKKRSSVEIKNLDAVKKIDKEMYAEIKDLVDPPIKKPLPIIPLKISVKSSPAPKHEISLDFLIKLSKDNGGIEVGIAYTSKKQRNFYLGTKKEIDYPIGVDKIIIHVHPGGSLTASDDDFISLILSGQRISFIVTYEKKIVRYVINDDILKAYYPQIVKRVGDKGFVNNHYKEYYPKFWNNYLK